MELKDFKKDIDKEIIAFFKNKLSSLSKYQNLEMDQLFEHVGKILLEGKRIRPYLAYLSYKSFGGKEDKKVIKFLSFIEIFHIFCLVHDDILDKADERHGVKTINKLYGNSQAMLIGDLLFSWSWEILLTNNNINKETIERIEKIFLEMIDEVFTGQMIDLNISSKNKVSNQEILQKMLLKTAGYSFIKPMMIGSVLAGVTKKDYDFIREFGTELGLAFQIQDDLLDIGYESKTTKKSAFNDIEQHQHTLFTNYVFEKGTSKQKEILNNLFGKKIKSRDRERLREVFFQSGAIKYGKELVLKHLNQAEKMLDKSVMDTKSKKLFSDLISGLINRSR